MEVYLQQLPQYLKRSLAPVYLLSGDEYLLIDESLLLIREQAQKQGFSSRISFTVDKNFDWQTLAGEFNNLSLFSDKQIIELRIGNAKFGDLGSKILQNYAANPSSDKLLIVIADKLDAASKKLLWYKSINDVGVCVNIWKLDRKQFSYWVTNKLKDCNLILDDEGIKLLLDHVEGNLLAASQEIEKLRILYGERKISIAELISAITEITDFNVYDLVENALCGDIGKVLRILQHLKYEGFEPAIMLWAITRELRNLIAILLKMESGEDLEQILQRQRTRPTQKIAIQKIIQRKKLLDLERILASAAQLDFIIKGAIAGDVWLEIEKILFAIASNT